MHNFVGLMTVLTVMSGGFSCLAAPAPNPRGNATVATARIDTSNDSQLVQRAATSDVRSREPVMNSGRVSARGAIVSKAMRESPEFSRTVARSAESSRGSVRSATANSARSAVSGNTSRSSISRATAVFSDVSKIGGGYATCRDAYATCMDQFCANANDKYRRCFCSSRFEDFRDTEAALDQAKTLLMQFEDNNLNAVDKTAAEVNAMYSATVGEKAIKRDTSGAAKILDQIGDLLSGKVKATSNSSSGSLGVLSFDISSDVDDIWGSGSSGSLFSSGSGTNLADLEGQKLYNASNSQCVAMMADTCSSDAILQMARSSYSILISQDCNAYEKKINSQRESVKQTVRTAEKYLREARLEEYRSHNSADVNECITKIRAAISADTACGANYKRCLDYTGAYINQTTGDAIYSPRLFELTNIISLESATNNNGVTDVLKQNTAFDKFLDSKRIFAASALDTCRDIANTAWTEFKRTALIEIAQAQDEKIEEVKMSCVNTMSECYDTQTSALKDFDDTTAQAAGALSVRAAREMCKDKVIACAALYSSDPNACKFDGNGKITSSAVGTCGLNQLLNFVNAVDKGRVAEACETTVDKYLTDLCTPSVGSFGYPYGCRTLKLGSETDWDKQNTDTIYGLVASYVEDTCNTGTTDSLGKIDDRLKGKVFTRIEEVRGEMRNMLIDICENTYDGHWVTSLESGEEYHDGFYTTVFGGNKNNTELGACMKNSIKYDCELQDALTGEKGYAKYNEKTNQCDFTVEWYIERCTTIGGYWENNTCYLLED